MVAEAAADRRRGIVRGDVSPNVRRAPKNVVEVLRFSAPVVLEASPLGRGLGWGRLLRMHREGPAPLPPPPLPVASLPRPHSVG